MLSKNKIKQVNSLKIKKYREKLGLFVAEGSKLVHEVMDSSMAVASIFATTEWLKKNPIIRDGIEIIEVSNSELEKLSELSSPQEVMAIVAIPQPKSSTFLIQENLSLALDDIQNPGNLGTIIRTADWFGIRQVFCSENSADIYNSKVIQASMGAVCRVNVIYTSLIEVLHEAIGNQIPVYGTFLKGENLYESTLAQNGIILLGNEGNGISPAFEPLVTHKIRIPGFPVGDETSESLNVAVAAGIVCAEFRRRIHI